MADDPYADQTPRTRDTQHQPDPNRVPSLQVPPQGQSIPMPPAAAALPAGVKTASPREPGLSAEIPQPEPSYYDISMLKQPVWKWQIAGYFFLGGLSAGAYTLARVADRIGGDRHRDLARLGTYVATAAFVPCPPLLIHDLGDPKRFHHMLRVWKPGTPMNLGTWSIVAYSGMLAAAVLRELLRDRRNTGPAKALGTPVDRALLFAHDAAGVPFAIMVAGYTGVLLSCTANPLWCKNPWLGPLFSASSVATGAEAISLALDLAGKDPDSPSQRALERIDTAAHATEAACLAGYTKHAGEKAAPLKHGSMKAHKNFSTAGLLAAEVLKLLPTRGRARRVTRMVAMGLGLASGFALRWAMVYGGQEAANNPHLARLNSRPRGAPPGQPPPGQPLPGQPSPRELPPAAQPPGAAQPQRPPT